MPLKGELNSIYYYNNHAIIVDKVAKEYCYVSDRSGILQVKYMIGFFICHEDLKEKEKQLKRQGYEQVAAMIDSIQNYEKEADQL